MALPDMAAYVDATDTFTGPNHSEIVHTITNNETIQSGGHAEYDVKVRYVVVNLSDSPSGKFWWMGDIYRNGERKLVVPATQAELGPHQSTVPIYYLDQGLLSGGEEVRYEAKLLVDMRDKIDETDDSNNNKANFKFAIKTVPL